MMNYISWCWVSKRYIKLNGELYFLDAECPRKIYMVNYTLLMLSVQEVYGSGNWGSEQTEGTYIYKFVAMVVCMNSCDN